MQHDSRPGSDGRGPTLAGLRFRHYRGRLDHPAMAAGSTRLAPRNGDPERVTRRACSTTTTPTCRTATSPATSPVVELDGRVVAYGRIYWADRTAGERAYESDHATSIRRLGTGDRARPARLADRRVSTELAADAPDDRPAIEAVYVYGTDRRSRSLVEGAGFAVVRRFCRADPAEPRRHPGPPAAGRVRGPPDRSSRSGDAPTRVATPTCAPSRTTGATSTARTRSFERFLDDPRFDPPLWRVAFHGDEIAGQILNFLDSADEDGRRIGWTESISVQPAVPAPRARPGAARATASGRSATPERPAPRSAWTPSNAAGALDLYESLGFRIVSDLFEFHRPVDRRGRTR